MADFSHVEDWVFDLDNTLYPADCHLFKQIDSRMASFIRDRLDVDEVEARRLQKHFYAVYGTTLSGLMNEHGVAPDEFLSFVHDIDVAVVLPDAVLGAAIEALPGRRYIFTNGSTRHAENVLGRLGIAPLFDDIFDIRAADFRPKPHRATYERFLGRFGVKATSAAMFEDLAHNLEAAHDLGMTTVLVASSADWFVDEPEGKRPSHPGDLKPAHVHHQTDNLGLFLSGLLCAPVAEGRPLRINR